jgi:hypothetical protein
MIFLHTGKKNYAFGSDYVPNAWERQGRVRLSVCLFSKMTGWISIKFGVGEFIVNGFSVFGLILA